MAEENGQSAKDQYVAHLRGQIERLQALLAAVESEGEILAPTDGVASRSRSVETKVRPDSFFGMTTPGAVKKFLEMSGKGNPQTAQDIAEALVKGGLDKPDNLDAVMKNIYTAFKRGKNVDFVKIGKMWGLVGWYPNVKAEDKAAKLKHPKREKASRSSRTPKATSAYRTFISEAMKAGKTMTEAAEAWREKQA